MNPFPFLAETPPPHEWGLGNILDFLASFGLGVVMMSAWIWQLLKEKKELQARNNLLQDRLNDAGKEFVGATRDMVHVIENVGTALNNATAATKAEMESRAALGVGELKAYMDASMNRGIDALRNYKSRSKSSSETETP